MSAAFNDMKKLRLAADVEDGHYDDRLPELISLGRGMFRLDKLEEIARKKVESLNFFDEVEVYLAYQVKLRDALSLPLDTRDMRHFAVSWVTPEELKNAEKDVKAAEKKDFFSYLSTHWQPMQSVLKRLHGEQYKKARDELMTAIEVDFPARLQARVKQESLQHSADAERIVAAQVMREIEQEINGRLTRNFLESKGLGNLLP